MVKFLVRDGVFAFSTRLGKVGIDGPGVVVEPAGYGAVDAVGGYTVRLGVVEQGVDQSRNNVFVHVNLNLNV